jgi:HAD superfamily hydrolase (TIGR01490 family)
MQRYAFFDLDGTIIKIKSMMCFLHYCCMHEVVAHDFDAALSLLERHCKNGASREQLNIAYYRLYRGGQWDVILNAGDQWFDTLELDAVFYSNIVARLRQHKKQGDEVVIVSGSFEPCVAPFARFLDIRLSLTAEPEVRGGVMTGELKQQTIGEGKAEAIARFLKHHRADLSRCYAYGDDVSDIPMLSSVGRACVVGHSPDLLDEAEFHGWERIEP